jgi:aminoglycoside phosphotransferase (APT) family kinase protein
MTSASVKTTAPVTPPLTRPTSSNILSGDTVYPALPSIEDILSSPTVLSALDASSKVVRVGATFAVKFGGTTSPTEAANLEYLSRQNSIPVPKFYTSFADPRTSTYFIVMQYIEGVTLEEALPTLTSQEKVDLVMQIRVILQDLRSLKSPGYLGSVNRLPYEDGVFNDTETLHPISGPFSSEDEFYAAIVQRFERTEPAPFVQLIRDLSKTMPRHETVFTHGDLQPKNILLQKTQERDGARKYKVILIDWEISGWYPAYWEFCNATIAGRFKSDWLNMIQELFTASMFGYEFLYMQFRRQLISY